MAIKLAKDRLVCFDRFATDQIAETEAKAMQERTQELAKAEQEKARDNERAALLAKVDEFKASLTKGFKDPSSAQYRNVVAYGIPGRGMISFMCGEINARNSYGAYVGYRRFLMIGIETSVIEDSKNPYVMNEMWPSTCKGTEVYRQSP